MDELTEKLYKIENEIEELTEEIDSIRAKMTACKSKAEPMTPEEEEWFYRAGIALSIKRQKVKKLNIKRNRINMARGEAKKAQQKDKERLQNELFYAKLKELMSESDLKAFTDECNRKINELPNVN